MSASPLRLAVVAGVVPLALLGCGSSGVTKTTMTKTTVTATDDACRLSATTLARGKHTFAITNSGTKTTEVYLYGAQGGAFTKVVEEKEHIGPGTGATVTADLKKGSYEVACKPGEKGDGIRTRLTVK